MLNISNDEMILVPYFNCNLWQSFDSSKSSDLIASYGHEGYAIFQRKTSKPFRLECKRPANLDEDSSEFLILEPPVMVSIDFTLTEFEELLCLSYVSTPNERGMIAVVREINKDVEKCTYLVVL